ncbi:MAG: hypothetical protein QE271_01945 [Bacteriovoracaceae bacterium]|nr:hypothetical protein [Bacteriovoracaceae bacterium]
MDVCKNFLARLMDLFLFSIGSFIINFSALGEKFPSKNDQDSYAQTYLDKKLASDKSKLEEIQASISLLNQSLAQNDQTQSSLGPHLSELNTQIQAKLVEIKSYDPKLKVLMEKQRMLEEKYQLRFFKTERKYLMCLGPKISQLSQVKYVVGAINPINLCEGTANNLTDGDVLALRKELLTQWKKTKDQLSQELGKLKKQYSDSTQTFNESTSSPTHIWRESLKELSAKSQELKGEISEILNFKSKFSSYLDCHDPNLIVNLEGEEWYSGSGKAGILYNKPRDDQQIFMVGTCYAHFSKDSITAVTDGEFTPSFLDIAYLNFNLVKADNDINSGGNPCSVLNKVKEIGVCDFRNSPLELIYFLEHNSSNPVTKNASAEIKKMWEELGQQNSANLKAINISANLKKLWEELNDFEEIKKSLPKTIVGQWNSFLNSWYSLETFNEQGKMILTDPASSSVFFEEWEKAQLYYSMYSKNPNHPLLKEATYLTALVTSWLYAFDLEITSKYFHEIQENCLGTAVGNERGRESKEKCKIVYQNLAKDFSRFLHNKFQSENLPDVEVNLLTDYRFNNFLRATAQSTWHNRLGLLKTWAELNPENEILFKNSTLFGYASIAEKIKIRLDSIEKDFHLDFSDFKKSFRELSEANETKVNFLKLMAPKCIDPANRKPLSKEIFCEQKQNPYLFASLDETDTNQDKIYHFRYAVLNNLLSANGNPVGNIHQFHVNSVVGVRFNAAKNICEYNIRESNGAKTFWMAEAELLRVNESLMTFKKLPAPFTPDLVTQ